MLFNPLNGQPSHLKPKVETNYMAYGCLLLLQPE